MVETTKTMKKKMVNRAYRSVPKTGTKIYGRIEGDKRDEPVTATSIAGIHMLCKGNDNKRNKHFLQQEEKYALQQYWWTSSEEKHSSTQLK